MKRYLIAAAAILALAGPANAAQIIMSKSNIVGSTPSFNNTSFDVGNIFNRQTGAIAPEGNFDGSFWLHRDNLATSYITIDLGDVYSSLSFDLFNTHNGSNFDRGVGKFEIFASNELTADGANGFTLGGSIARLVSDTMLAEHDNAIDAQTYTSTKLGGYRYIQFRPLSVAATIPYKGSPYAYGLNEMRIYGELGGVSGVPEPGAWALMIIGFAGVGTAVRRSRRQDLALAA